MTTVAYAAVTQSGLSFDRQLWMRPEIIPGLRRLTDAIHAEGAAAGIQLGHCGNMSHKSICGCMPVGASSGFNLYSPTFVRGLRADELPEMAGYKVRMARGGGRLFLLLATDGQVYARPYFNIDGQVFYILDDVPRAASYNICNFTIPGERPLSLAMPAPPLFAQNPAAPAVRNFDGVVSTTVTVNRNLMDFYTNYPPCHWSVYAATALTAPVCGQLYPPLRAAVAGKGEREAAELLLHYLHRAFPYKTDEAQFGIERTLFAEEMYYYPYSDCEDRSILFARLVKDLLGLDVVLLYYPAHIAAAVCFKGEVKGDYMQLGNKRYVICDATYIGAGVGEAMPDLKRTPAQVVRID